MTIPRRQRRLTGRHAWVDGIRFKMPVNSERSPALMAAFSLDAERAAALLPGGELHPFRLANGRGVLLITVIDYRETDIGKYVEFSIAIACTHGARPAPPMLPALMQGRYGTGQFVIDLPVSSQISVRGGKGIWGMPKHQANLDFLIDDRQVSSQYDLDGELAMRITVDRGPQLRIPLSTSAANYCEFRGMLMKSRIHFSGGIELALGRRSSAQLLLGDSPAVDKLRSLDIASQPFFTGFLPNTHGILDDHYESWFLTYEQPPQEHHEGLESVIDASLSEQWLDSPKAAGR